jgi:TPR repeat protein
MKRLDKPFYLSIPAMLLVTGCGGNGETTQTIASATPATNGSATSNASANANAKPPEVRSTVQRKKSPLDKRKADEAACAAGKIEACRAMAERYQAYGHPSGCGLEREGYRRKVALGDSSSLDVRIKRASEEWETDETGFTNWMDKACQLGDPEACKLEGEAAASFREVQDKAAANMALRSSPESSALFGWKKIKNPKLFATVLEKRSECVKEWYSCARNGEKLYQRDEPKAPTELDNATRELAEGLISKTLDARMVFLLLDKNRYTQEMLAPVRTHAAKVLVEACLEGSCVCGDAAHFVPNDDARRVDLARLGCENGEAEGCYELGRSYEEGRGVTKDEKLARALYELACPPYHPVDGTNEPTTGEYSAAACDRLAEKFEGGTMPPKDIRNARYYAEFACKYPGMQYDHAVCVRLARYWAAGVIRTDCDEEWCPTNMMITREKFYGASAPPFAAQECERPSVRDLCATYRPEIERMK